MPNKHAVDVRLYLVLGKKGLGKSTIAISLAIQESINHSRAPIYSNMDLNIPGIPTFQVSKVKDLLQQCSTNPCTCAPRIIVTDEFDKSLTSRIGWVEKTREQKLVELVSNIRKHNVIAFIATSQLRKKIKNDYRHNADFVIEPTGTLDSADCPEYFVWQDVELYESAGKGRYDHAEFCSSILPIEFLDSTFNTRQVILLEWD